ncbi:MAG: hypothetical protein SPF89_04315 [Sphaerochaetaceae bacterium]|nr:hypothetical protein [Spirochaetales bacterium]MDY5499308.1 hypothetical protein [Sphaerochaetaceae bacterium]
MLIPWNLQAPGRTMAVVCLFRRVILFVVLAPEDKKAAPFGAAPGDSA